MFNRIDTSDDRQISLAEFTSKVPELRKWGATIEDAEAEFRRIDADSGEMLLFTDFCAWALEHAPDLEDDDDWQPATPASATATVTATATATSSTALEAPPAPAAEAPAVVSSSSALPQRHPVGSTVSTSAACEVQADGGACSGGLDVTVRRDGET